MYNITLTENNWQPLAGVHFKHSTDGTAASQHTFVELKHTSTHLHIRFRCENDPFVNQNAITEHNDDLFNQEVFEVFISPSEADSINYLEVELNPNNALWVGHVFNPSLGKENGKNVLTMVAYDEAKIKHFVKKQENRWEGEISLPWELIGNKSNIYRINFYRIVLKSAQTNADWIGNPEICDYTCWSPTMSGKEPAFHRPKRFGVLRLA